VTDTFIIHIARALKRLMVFKTYNSLRNASDLTTLTSDQRLYMHMQANATLCELNYSHLYRKFFCLLLCKCIHIYGERERHTHIYIHYICIDGHSFLSMKLHINLILVCILINYYNGFKLHLLMCAPQSFSECYIIILQLMIAS